ncbi:hypothetical protein ACJ73_05565 [Blastomyces percursus]|uniref:Uncharacterized protein n=1 Tax=Blastomyces percursus TaxID=1658174 RepID=A0A1J9R625_9EURO|nr:hypothetical protein ACJ73_05565 [Blastomyces percursus]
MLLERKTGIYHRQTTLRFSRKLELQGGTSSSVISFTALERRFRIHSKLAYFAHPTQTRPKLPMGPLLGVTRLPLCCDDESTGGEILFLKRHLSAVVAILAEANMRIARYRDVG